MNRFERFADAFGDTLGVLEDARELKRHDLVVILGDETMAKQIEQLSQTYFGATRYKKQQQAARDAVRANNHHFGALEVMERYVRKLSNGKKKHKNAWTLRRNLARIRGGLKAIRAAARTMVATFNGDTATRPARTQASMSNPSNRLDRTIHLTGPEAAIAEVWETARDHAAATKLSIAEALFDLFNSSGGVHPENGVESPGSGRTRYTPMVIVSVGDLEAIHSGDTDVILSATNGARIPGKDFLDMTLTDHGFFMLTSRVSGPVDLYRTDRFFSAKQRTMAKACDPVCSIPGCGQPADRCEPNHNKAWSAGGDTNIKNLSVLCRYHNGKVDDNRSAERFGYVERIRGESMFISAFGGRPKRNDHPTARGGALRIA